jgi:single-stranded-DNA-specific exonuclease
MDTPQAQWQVVPTLEVPQWFIEAVQLYTPNSEGLYGAQLLWQRGIRDPNSLPGYINPDHYHPASPFAFGQEMKWAVKRLLTACEQGERVTIWGDFDADGITSTSVLWEGLGQFFPQYLQLNYYIPDRFKESHGLNCSGIERLAATGTKLIVTCDTGSTNLPEIEYAQELGIDIIVTDHHTLPETRPPVVAIINPRYFASTHPLYYLSGVAVAYKLVEAVYETLPHVPQHPRENLLDLVAIGLIADLVELRGDCRYLAQKGIRQLQKQVNPATVTRPGVSCLLELCRRNGDRPTDISFGLGPRINAVSRIHGDAHFCVELLTSCDRQRCQQLAEETELANTRRKSLQKDILRQVKQKIERLDLSTTSVIVLEDSQWQGGVLGLVAGQIAQEYGRPTILLSSGEIEEMGDRRDGESNDNSQLQLAKGSARSINNIDLYQLVQSQEHLLHRFGGHPFAAGLSLPLENLSLFREGINQQLRQQLDATVMMPIIEADLRVSVAELGKDLFNQLSLLEPYGMGNPIPKLLIQNCWFKKVWNKNIKDTKGNTVQYIKTHFELWDDSVKQGFPGVWWGHYQDEIPQNIRCDGIVELDFDCNGYQQKKSSQGYEVRLVAVRPQLGAISLKDSWQESTVIIDRRNHSQELEEISLLAIEHTLQEELNKTLSFNILATCPSSWDEMQKKYRQAIASEQVLVLAYPSPGDKSPQSIWEQLVGIAKYLSRTGQTASKRQIQEKLNLSDRTFTLGIKAVTAWGFSCQNLEESYQFNWNANLSVQAEAYKADFLGALEEEQFQRQYFYQIPVPTLQEILNRFY